MSAVAGQIRSIVERVERLNEEKDALAADIREVFAEAKSNGYDVAALKKIIALRKIDAAERQEQEAILDLYLSALGMGQGPVTMPKTVQVAGTVPPPPPPPPPVPHD